MKIVNRETFLKQPINTVFSKYELHSFQPLSIKGQTTLDGSDFFYSSIADAISAENDEKAVNLAKASLADSVSIPMDFCSLSRDGCYDEEQLFAIWEREDIQDLIVRLHKCLRAV